MLHFRIVRDAQSDKPPLPEQAQEVFYSVEIGVRTSAGARLLRGR
jgi:hypothetical protein